MSPDTVGARALPETRAVVGRATALGEGVLACGDEGVEERGEVGEEV